MAVNIGLPSDGEANHGWKLYITSLIMVLCAGLLVTVRVWTRFKAVRLGADDYTIVASLCFSIFLSISIQLAIVNGYGKRKQDLTIEELRTCLKYFWVAQTPYKIVVCLNKTSVLLLYKRIFITRHFQWLCISALVIIIGSGVASTLAAILQCIPIQRSWDKSIEGTCIDNSKFWLANAVLNISTDVLVLALPVREIYKLHLKAQEKVMVYCLFLLGGIVTATSVLRVTAVANSVRNQQDITFNFIPRGIWTLIEANLGIICACLTVLRRPAQRLIMLMTHASKPTSSYDGNRNSKAAQYASEQAKDRDVPLSRVQHSIASNESVDDEDRSTWVGDGARAQPE
ncbi:hypothetical protein LEMA_P086350.1 [Plenodomus lingam JN3]|uniref:Rhodopsin domain-containing protein n=1 Tax=Leptosphaeria maculans (strain JN3 / isolate v23.1.3 / race Av1-4-5-6-7-8) TaxID=985895 RepID=E5A701_LEPMJ|nr:hypothetical protein LEMA_P086350.1 [Plenodomus lingam JN3]CBX99396.1 hypothetical protein LEMA_P086350.1 [Plenodomus lingam JN3]